MKSKTLETIQKLCKFGKIASLILVIYNIAGILVSAAGFFTDFRGMAFFVWLLRLEEEVTEIGYRTRLVDNLTYFGHELILCYLAYKYFKDEVEEGTPLTEEGYNDLMRHAKLTFILPLVACALYFCLDKIIVPEHDFELELEWEGFVSRGFACLGFAYLSKLGMEQQNKEE